jgi:hypothetical protein
MTNAPLEYFTAALQQTIWPIFIAVAVFVVIQGLAGIFIRSRFVRFLILLPILGLTLYVFLSRVSRPPVVQEKAAAQTYGATVDGKPVKLR